MATTTKRTPDQLVRALLEKTVGRGATPGEQDAAVEKARALCAKHGLDPTGFEWPPERIAGPTGARTIRAICEELILKGVPTAKILEAVRAERGPAVKTSPGCVAWYRSKMVKKGLIPSARRGAPK
jgi:Protein of unknown function (DUF2786)